MRRQISAGLLAWALLSGGAAAADRCAGAALPDAPAALLRTELFLGMGLSGGRVVGPKAWARFEREVLAPQLCGYTVLDIRGGWLGRDGRVLREPAKLVVLVHRGGPEADAAIATVAAAWRTRFGQEAVLRASQPIEGGLLR